MSQQKIAQSDSGALSGGANEARPAVGGGVLAARLAQGCGREAAKDGGGRKKQNKLRFSIPKKDHFEGICGDPISFKLT